MIELDRYVRSNLRTKQLQLLVAVDDFRNLSKVAAHAHVSQPAVSKSLGELERGLGLKLFERTARGVAPTVYGECLVRHARSVLSGLDQARDELRGLLSGASGRICVGVLPGAVPALLPQSLALLKGRSPNTNVLLREGTMETLLPELWQEKLDLIVGRLPARSGQELGEKILSEEPVTLVAGPHHPLAKRRRLHWLDVKEYPWVLPPVGALLREPLERAFEQHALPMPVNTIETLSIHVVSVYLQLTDAIGTMARDVAKYYQGLGQLAVLPLGFPRLLRPLGITWSRQRPLSPSTKLLMQCLEEVARPTQRTQPKKMGPGNASLNAPN